MRDEGVKLGNNPSVSHTGEGPQRPASGLLSSGTQHALGAHSAPGPGAPASLGFSSLINHTGSQGCKVAPGLSHPQTKFLRSLQVEVLSGSRFVCFNTAEGGLLQWAQEPPGT